MVILILFESNLETICTSEEYIALSRPCNKFSCHTILAYIYRFGRAHSPFFHDTELSEDCIKSCVNSFFDGAMVDYVYKRILSIRFQLLH